MNSFDCNVNMPRAATSCNDGSTVIKAIFYDQAYAYLISAAPNENYLLASNLRQSSRPSPVAVFCMHILFRIVEAPSVRRYYV